MKRISSRRRTQLVQIYLHEGPEAARAACIAEGLSPNYAAKRASDLGLSHRRAYTGIKTKAGINHADLRWKWAQDRGALVR